MSASEHHPNSLEELDELAEDASSDTAHVSTDFLDERGRVLWHCSEEEGGPDVGLSLGLGGGFSLYFGEMPVSTLTEHDIDVKETGDGWWIVMYGPGRMDTEVAALVVSTEAARAIFDKLTEALAPAPTERQGVPA